MWSFLARHDHKNILGVNSSSWKYLNWKFKRPNSYLIIEFLLKISLVCGKELDLFITIISFPVFRWRYPWLFSFFGAFFFIQEKACDCLRSAHRRSNTISKAISRCIWQKAERGESKNVLEWFQNERSAVRHTLIQVKSWVFCVKWWSFWRNISHSVFTFGKRLSISY